MSYFGTPRNPLRSGKMVTIGGAWEAEYLGFVNRVPDPLHHARYANVASGMTWAIYTPAVKSKRQRHKFSQCSIRPVHALGDP